MNKNKVTYIEELIDLDEITGQPQKLPNGMDPNYNKQIMSEIADRESAAKPLQSKLRNNVDFRVAMNGGRPPVDDFYLVEMNKENYELGPKAMQNVGQNYYPGHNAVANRGLAVNSVNENYYGYGQRKFNNYGYNDSYNSAPIQYPYERNAYFEEPYTAPFNCLDVSNHLKSCPICSKLYDNDKSVYIVAIVILVIIVIILLKKVIENIGNK